VTTVPTWAALAVSIGTPLLTFVGVLVAQRIARVGAVELEARSRREELMRTLRWAAELAVSDHLDKARLGLAQLKALDRSTLLGSDQQGFIDAALKAAIDEPATDTKQATADDRVIQVGNDGVPSTDEITTELSSIEQSAGGEGGKR
jgi:hypothetical protein